MRRLPLLMALLMLPVLALGEGIPQAPSRPLRAVTTAGEVEAFLLMPEEDSLADVKRGYIRYISQNEWKDELFRAEYWLGGERGSVLDLTIRERYGVKFDFYAGNMCSRAAYAMAVSYLGVDVTPGGMSAMLQTRNLYEPYDNVSSLVGVERVDADRNAFNRLMENYLTDDSYSPVYVYFRRPNGTCHAVLVVAAMPDAGRYLVVDSNPPSLQGQLKRVYFISFNKARTRIINSTFRQSLAGSTVLQLCQWHLPEDSPENAP
ncbi:MAG: hypothetical protein PUC00_04930 [Clostridiales bacterium]|nr:hypothetical protein [Clostridiales bacterium]